MSLQKSYLNPNLYNEYIFLYAVLQNIVNITRFGRKVLAGMMINFPLVESCLQLPRFYLWLYYVMQISSCVSIMKNCVYIVFLKIKLFVITKRSTAAEYRVLFITFLRAF